MERNFTGLFNRESALLGHLRIDDEKPWQLHDGRAEPGLGVTKIDVQR